MSAFLKLAGAFLRGIPAWAWVALALLAAGLVYGHLRFNAGQAETQARWDAREAIYATQRAEAILAARVLEQRHRDELKAVADRFLADQREADEDHAAAVAAVRAGAVRVRDRLPARPLECPQPQPIPEALLTPAPVDFSRRISNTFSESAPTPIALPDSSTR